jgi:head-tail adaptor
MVGPKITVVLSKVTETIGSQGETVQLWSDIDFLYGTLNALSGKESFVDGKWRVKSDYTFRTEPSKKCKIDESYKLRIPSQQREFDIVGVGDALEQGIQLKIDLLERR